MSIRLTQGRSYGSDVHGGSVHHGHGGMLWQGRTNGHPTWRCIGCGDTVFHGRHTTYGAAS